MGIITFLSDFGLKDSYVGTVKGIIMSINPSVRIIDISHEISPFDIRSAAYNISRYYKYYPGDTIHLAVVDPGVGGNREPLILKTANYIFIGPDNGLLSYILKQGNYKSYIIDQNKLSGVGVTMFPAGNTFHARDVFAPAAAYLSTGGKPEDIARRKTGIPKLIDESLVISENQILACILTIDHFGNIITELNISHLESIKKRSIAEIRYKDYIFRKISETYENVAVGTPLVLWGSSGHLEISVNQGNAADFFAADKQKDKIEIIIA
jgi:S-adenosylmethionine hydrolase